MIGILIACLLLILGIGLQFHLFLNWDVSWHLIITQRFLNGGHYVKNFMDMNPPILMFTLIPAVLLHKLIGFSLTMATRVYVFGLGIISSITLLFQWRRCSFDKFCQAMLLAVCAFIFFILPLTVFAQREHLVLLFILPYFFLVISRYARERISKWLAFWVGIYAGVGFLINIQYFVIFLVLEIFLFLKLKKESCKRPEPYLIIATGLIYLVSIFIFTPNYFTKILPLVTHYYLTAYNATWLSLIMSITFISWLITAVLFVIYRRSAPKDSYSYAAMNVLFIANTLFMLQYLLTRKLWYYHLLPTLSVSLLLLTVYLFIDLRLEKPRFYLSKLVLALSAILILGYFTMGLTNSLNTYNPYRNNIITKLIKTIQAQPKHSSLYFFTTSVIPGPTIAVTTDLTLASRFGSLWLLPAVLAQPENKTLRALFFNTINEDFQHYQPDVVIIDRGSPKPYIADSNFQYLPFLLQNPTFKKIWPHYQFVTNVENFAIYRRKNHN